jgi:hypothetical protein
LAEDKVVGVRMAVASLLPQLRACCHPHADQALLDRLESVQASLQADPDSNVATLCEANMKLVKLSFSGTINANLINARFKK